MAVDRAFGLPSNFPYLNEQTLGAFFGLCPFFVWTRWCTKLPSCHSLFFGLILGDYVMGSLWSLAGIVFSTETYQFYP